MNDRYTTTRQPYARATGAPPVMAGSYTCPELGRTCTRPGAYDAMALPSLFNGRQRAPALHSPATSPKAEEDEA